MKQCRSDGRLMTERLCEELVEAGIVAWLPVLEIDVGNTWKSWKYHCRFSFLIDPPSFIILRLVSEERILLVVNHTTEVEMTRLFKQREEARVPYPVLSLLKRSTATESFFMDV